MRFPLLLISILAACGPQKGGSDESSGGSGSVTDAPTGSATDTPTGSATDTPTGSVTDAPTGGVTDTSTTAEPVSCEMFESPSFDLFKRVDISIVSKRAEPVWIGAWGCSGIPTLQILGADAQNVFSEDSQCSPAFCQDFLGADDCTQGCDDCGSAVARRVGPGTTFGMTWGGAHLIPMQMTAECAPGNNCQRECMRPELVAPGSYSVELTVFAACTGACACDDLDPNASCALWDSLETGEPFTVKATMTYPDADSIELVIE